MTRSLRSPYHPFDAWIVGQGKTREWAASRLETTAASLSRIVSGKQWPGPDFFERVESLTKGQITAEHFVNPKKPIKQPQPPSEASGDAAVVKEERKTVRVKVRIDNNLLAEAANLGIEIDAIAENFLREKIKQEKVKRWQAEHADVIAWYNEHIEKDGIFGEGWRTF
jgi:antitoxin CcdA